MLKFLSIFIFTLLTIIPAFGSIIVPADVVEGQDTERNFVGRKGHFEKTANGVNGYDDGSAATPVDGTGGATITTTCTRTTTTPLDGDGSLIITKDAADRRGEGCSLDFTIPSAMKAKVMQIEFDYQVASGTFAAGSSSTNSDVIAYVYDVTNSTLIEPSSIKLLTSSTTIPDRFVANFQTSATGTNYRLMFHISTTSSSAWVLEVDSVKIKPSKYTYGTPITDWVSYTPAGTWSTTFTGLWRRVGQDMEVKFQAAISGGVSGNFTVNIPSGYTIDTTKLLSTGTQEELGFLRIVDGGSAVYHGALRYNSTVSMIGINLGAAGTYLNEPSVIDGTTPITFGASDFVNGFFKVPITGWSSSAQVSDGYDSRDVSFNARGTPTGTLNTGYNKVTFAAGTVLSDTVAGFSSGTYTIRAAGKYDISYNQRMDWATGVVNGDSGIAIYINGANVSEQFVKTGATGVLQAMPIVTLIGRQLNAGDTVEFYSYNSNTTPTFNTGTISVARRQSPTTISATEVVAASYQMGTAQTLTATATIKFDTKVVDTHNAYNTATGVFTAPVSGLYEVSAQLFSITATAEWTPQIRKQSSAVVRTSPSPVFNTGTTINNNQSMARFSGYLVELNAGQTLDIYNGSAIGTGTIYNSTVDNWLTIKRIK